MAECHHDPGRARSDARRHRQRAQAQGGHPLRPGQGQLCRRPQAAGHAVRRLRAQPVRPRADQVDRRLESEGAARRACGAHRRGPEAVEPALDADARGRRADGAGRRQGAVPEPGDRLRGGGRPLHRGRCGRADRGRLRGAAGDQRPEGRARRGRAGAARGPCRQDHGPARRAQAPQPHLHLGGRRSGRDRAGVRRRRGHGQGRDFLSARPPLPARDLRDGRLDGQGEGRAHGLGDVSGAARGAHRRLAAVRHSRSQDPHHRARHRRRLRQQGRRLSGLCLRDRRLDRAGRAGQVGRGPDREPFRDRVRARLPHDRRAGGEQGRQDHGPSRPRPRRPRRVRCLRRSDQVPGRVLLGGDRLLRHPDRTRRSRGRLHQQGARRRRVPLLVPGDRGLLSDRAHGRRAGAQAEDRSGRVAAQELHQAGAVPLPLGVGLGIRFRRLPDGHAKGHGRRSTTRRCAGSRRTSAPRAS